MSSAIPGQCPACGKSMRLPADAAGKKVKCGGCGTVLRIHAAADGLRLSLLQPDAATAPATDAPASDAAAPGACPGCGEPAQQGDAFCNHCGVDLSEAAAVARRKAENRADSERRRGRRGTAHRRNKVLSAARILAALAVLFLIAGTYQGYQASRDARRAHAHLADYDPGEVLELDGATMTVAELRRTIDLEVMLSYGINYLLAGIMLALFFWARRSAFPAMLTGLCVYLVVVVLNGVLEPGTLLQGIFIKIVIVSGLVGGMSAALGERAAARQQGRAPARPARSTRRAESA